MKYRVWLQIYWRRVIMKGRHGPVDGGPARSKYKEWKKFHKKEVVE